MSDRPVRSDNRRGASRMLASGLTHSVAMALVKLLGDDYSSATENVVRQAIGMLCRLPFILRAPREAFTMRRPLLMITRRAATSAMMAADRVDPG